MRNREISENFKVALKFAGFGHKRRSLFSRVSKLQSVSLSFPNLQSKFLFGAALFADLLAALAAILSALLAAPFAAPLTAPLPSADRLLIKVLSLNF